ncbi:hypothetical protein [Aliivibrio fischeri]|uniref:hypothetical protein n=1 Tax=Aliivibrio fischeri TaxID=668 RepID=UPI0012DA85A1|nr:hypothetical protein [Aliivibrio fischeri]MUJ22590.1 hypothetical protein [Aliivibrio fischeri]
MRKRPICSKFRKLDSHLYELASYCSILGNKVTFKDDEGLNLIQTTTIGDWLRLAAQLDKVEINTWKFTDGSELFCEPAADAYDSDTNHYSSYSTALTKFIFVSNALEEMYRFISPAYLSCDEIKNKRLFKPSMQATALIDLCNESDLPLYFHHKVESLVNVFQRCNHINTKSLSGMKGVKKTDYSYGLHLIRNIRNYVAHGVFPISENPEWNLDFEGHQLLCEVLLSSSRIACLYIQILLNKYNTGMQSDDYRLNMRGEGPEFDYFCDNCTPDLALKLHMIESFSFLEPLEC